jgi:hypothetical protein
MLRLALDMGKGIYRAQEGVPMYLALNQDEFDEARPGIAPDHAKTLLQKLQERIGCEDQAAVSEAQPDGSYHVRLDHEDLAKAFVHFLDQRGIWYEQRNEPTAGPTDSTIGVIFLRVDEAQVPRGEVRGAVVKIARELAEASGGTFQLRYGSRREKGTPYYWVGFNDRASGVVFGFWLKARGVKPEYHASLPGGERPVLPPVDLSEVPDISTLRTGSPEEPTGALAAAQGFAQMQRLLRTRVGDTFRKQASRFRRR